MPKKIKIVLLFFFSRKICLLFLLCSPSSPQNKHFPSPLFPYCYPFPKNVVSVFFSIFFLIFWKEEANQDTQAKQTKLFCKLFLKGFNLHPSIVLSILPKHFCPAPLKMKAFLVIPFFLNSSDTILPILTCTLAVKKATYIMI